MFVDNEEDKKCNITFLWRFGCFDWSFYKPETFFGLTNVFCIRCNSMQQVKFAYLSFSINIPVISSTLFHPTLCALRSFQVVGFTLGWNPDCHKMFTSYCSAQNICCCWMQSHHVKRKWEKAEANFDLHFVKKECLQQKWKLTSRVNTTNCIFCQIRPSTLSYLSFVMFEMCRLCA